MNEYRKEQVTFKITLDGNKLTKRDKRVLQEAEWRSGLHYTEPRKCDAVNFTYTVHIDYFSGVADVLALILRHSKDSPFKVSYKELLHGKSLALKLGQLLGELAERKKGGK